MREIIKSAATVDEAIELALSELNLTREEVTAEVLEYPEKKFFFKKPAKVKVCEIKEDIDLKEIFSEKPQKVAEKKEVVKQAAPEVKKEEVIQPKIEKATSNENNETNEKAEYAISFLKSIIDQFYDKEYTLTANKTEKGYTIEIGGVDVGMLIGRKGETMEALSYLTSLAANGFSNSDERISVDIANYRQKRQTNLEEQAKKMAQKVLKTSRPYTFEAMSPYDRRIIHSIVGEIEGVKSESKGEGASRRVVIIPTTPRKRNYNNNNNGKKPYQKRNNSNSQRKENSPPQVQKTRDEKKNEDTKTSLYSKVEL